MKRGLLAGLTTYLAGVALFLGVASQWRWSVFVTFVGVPLIASVVIGTVFVILMSLFLTPRLRGHDLMSMGFAMLLVGLCFLLVGRMQPNISSLVGYDVTNFGASAIGIGIAFFGLDIARTSDNRMKAIANLEFYEKMAMIENYLSQVRNNQNVVVKALGYDVDGVKALGKFVEPQLKKELDKKLEELEAEAKKHVPPYAELIVEIQRCRKR